MFGEVFYSINEVIIIVICAILFFVSSEIGFVWGRRRLAQTRSENLPHTDIIEAALLSLLALLLGFTFMMAMTRFDVRKQALLEEANDIRIALLRTDLLPNQYQPESRRLLRDYVNSRIAFYRAGVNPIEKKQALQWSNTLQSQLWVLGVSAVLESPNEVTTGSFRQSLENIINDHAKRLEAMNNHVPEVIWFLLILVTIFTLAANGYSCGLKDSRTFKLRLVLVFLIASVLLVTVDLDRPRRGLIQVSEHSLIELQEFFSRVNP